MGKEGNIHEGGVWRVPEGIPSVVRLPYKTAEVYREGGRTGFFERNFETNKRVTILKDTN